MILLVTGETHSGKSVLAQKLLRRHGFPVLPLDHLKMGLIRSGLCPLPPEAEDREIEGIVWPVAREWIRTCIENGQDLIVEGVYVPFEWRRDFSPGELEHIRYVCLILSRQYIETRWEDILAWENAAEQRRTPGCGRDALIRDNERNLAQCLGRNLPFVLIEDRYPEHLEEVFG